MPRYCFEDFIPGTTEAYGDKTVDKDEMIAFARVFDPQPMHIDEVAAREGFTGTLIASGWHTAAMHMRMICDAFLLDSSSMGSPGVDELKWLRPVCPGDRLSARRTVLAARVSASRPDRGIVTFRFEVVNQRGETVLEQKNSVLFGLRHPGRTAPAPETGGASHPPAHAVPTEGIADIAEARSGLAYFDEIAIGTVLDLGSLDFSQTDIVAYARQFDPQYFHVDPAAARHSPFGRLIASGWHTAAGWMRTMAGDRMRRVSAAAAAGEPAARLGPSPGFNTLRWLRPVAASDTISYRSKLVHKRASASRPGWGLVFHHNTGTNQAGELVFSFNGAVFWERRQP